MQTLYYDYSNIVTTIFYSVTDIMYRVIPAYTRELSMYCYRVNGG